MKSDEKSCYNCISSLHGGTVNCGTCTNFSNWEDFELDKSDSSKIREPCVEHIIVDEVEQGQKFDDDKLDWTLMPWDEMQQVLEILEFGVKKYSRNNWKKIESSRYEKAAMRHLISYITGEKNDSETGKSHMAHLVCNALFLMWNDNKSELD